MKLSQFTILIPDFPLHGKYLVYNTFNRATAVIGERAKNFLSDSQNASPDDKKKYMDTFSKLGLMIDDSIDESKEFRDWYNKARYNKSIMRATILTTYNCNFACEYCVEEGVKKPVKMDEEHCQNTVKWLINRINKHQSNSIQLQFYGGEPLMNVKPIHYIATEISEYSKKNGISFGFTITTNGSLLKPDLVERLAPLGLKTIKITLDGDRDAHNSKRPFKNGKGSFDIIIQNMLQVIDKVRIKIGTNVDSKNFEGVPRMLDYLEKIGLKDKIESIKFSPIIHIQEQGKMSQWTHQVNCSPASDQDTLDNLIQLTWDAHKRGFKTEKYIESTICAMRLDGTAVVIDPLGRIYTCPAFVGREGFQVGDIYHQDISGRHEEFMNMEISDECFECPYMPMCNGGCKHLAYTKYGDLSKTVCEKEHFQKAIVESLKMQVLSQRE